jgi:DNA-binding response OmpR family regulator
MTEDTTKQEILVVEDDLDLLHLSTLALKHKNYSVHSCVGGGEALWFLRNNHVDLLVTDIGMPGISGRDLLTTIKQEQPGIKVLIITAKDVNLMEYKLLGALDVLQKPFEVAQLQHAVFTALYKEKRIDGRVPVSFDVSVDKDISCHSLNLSLGGILLDMVNPMKAGDTVKLAMSIPQSRGKITVNGRILHSHPFRSRYQTAVRFLGNVMDQISGNSQALLQPAVNLN